MQQLNNTTYATTLAIAESYVAAGLGVIPINANGTKHSAVTWKEYQTRIATDSEVEAWFGGASEFGIGVVTGAVSGNLETLDFDDATVIDDFTWTVLTSKLSEKFKQMLHVSTPKGGKHLYYRCAETPEGSQKLAMTADNKVRIETRGEGAYILAPGCPPACHPTGNIYTVTRGSLADIPVLTPEERDKLLSIARSFDMQPRAVPVSKPVAAARIVSLVASEMKPGDAFNSQATWLEVLEPHGWSVHRKRDGSQTFWQRPGAKTRNYDAATNRDGTDRMWCWSPNAGLPTETYLSKYAVFAMLNHGGNFSEATKQLALMGYGKSFARQTA